jgi:hypothetical protein
LWRHTATGLQASTITSQSGESRLSALAPGVYTVSATAQGFKQAIQESASLHAGERIDLNFSMVLGQRTETLIVGEFPGALQTESAQIKDVIENQQVVDLPVQQTGKLINILGQRTGHNLFLVDGASVTDEYFNNVVLNQRPDAIHEFNIAKANFDAEFGGKSGGIINVITQGGTNLFHRSFTNSFGTAFSMPATSSLLRIRRRHFRRISLESRWVDLSRRTRRFSF